MGARMLHSFVRPETSKSLKQLLAETEKASALQVVIQQLKINVRKRMTSLKCSTDIALVCQNVIWMCQILGYLIRIKKFAQIFRNILESNMNVFRFVQIVTLMGP